jgi:hypothetical protein
MKSKTEIRWIAFDEKHPPMYGNYLVVCGGVFGVALYNSYREWQDFHFSEALQPPAGATVTHWAHFPDVIETHEP